FESSGVRLRIHGHVVPPECLRVLPWWPRRGMAAGPVRARTMVRANDARQQESSAVRAASAALPDVEAGLTFAPTLRVEIVTIGNEVLSGRTFDTNFVFLARALEEASVVVAFHTTIGDNAEAIGEALKFALTRADAVIMTGGLGPTPDDMTRKAVATALER